MLEQNNTIAYFVNVCYYTNNNENYRLYCEVCNFHLTKEARGSWLVHFVLVILQKSSFNKVHKDWS